MISELPADSTAKSLPESLQQPASRSLRNRGTGAVRRRLKSEIRNFAVCFVRLLAGTRHGFGDGMADILHDGEPSAPGSGRNSLILDHFQQLLVQLPKMPLEILALIFEDVGPFDFALSLSDNLAPFIPSNRYAKLQLSYPAFLELCTRLRGDPHLAKFVVELAITFTSGNCFDYDLNDEEFVFDFLRSATSLTSLSVKHNPRFRSRVLSAKFVVASYAALKTLSFDHESPNPPNSLSHQYRYLALTPPLDRLSITWEFGESDLLDEPVFTAEESAELEAGDVLALAAAGITGESHSTWRAERADSGRSAASGAED